MKLQSTIPEPLISAYPKAPKSNSYQPRKIKSQVPPPDEETLERLNAIVKEYPFCIYYKQKNNDPL
ncbi:MAG TPA: hypothetical protein VNV85_17410 [Puia sp.]|nr:hypothetical protein [Puia sp.]